MRFIAFMTQTDPRFPEGFPAECKEFDSREEAEAACPDWEIMSAQDYLEHKATMDSIYIASLTPDSPWWKFWA